MVENTEKNSLRQWMANARSSSLAQSGMPACLAVVLALGQGHFSLLLAALAVLGVMSAHLGMNLADDYFDYKADMLSDRDKVLRQGFRAMMVKYPYLTDGSQTPKTLLRAIIYFLLFAVGCGAVIFCLRTVDRGLFGADGSWWIVAIACVCCFLGIFYSAPPLKLAYRGLGEPVIGLIFGPLLMMGVYYSACGTINPEVVWISIPVGLLVLNILFTHSFVERASDAASNKMTLARLLVSNRNNMIAALAINFLPFVMVAVAVAIGSVHPAYLAVLLMIPRSVWLCRSLADFNRGNTGVPEKPLRWLGPMREWEPVRAAGADFFLMRWLTARNILSGFCLITLIVRLLLILF